MAKGNKCDSCGKGIMYGHNVSHAKNRTRKIFKPNLHTTRVVIAGVSQKLKLCTKCQRIVKENVKNIKAEKVAVVEAPVVVAAAAL